MFTSNIKGIERALKEKNVLITISTNKKNVYVLKSVNEEEKNVYTGYNFRNVLIKASKFLPEGKNENLICVVSNDKTQNSIEFALKDAGLKMIIYLNEGEYNVELYLKSDKQMVSPWVAKKCPVKQGLLTVINELEKDMDKKLFDYKVAHPKDFGLDD